MKLFPVTIIIPTYNRIFILKDMLPKYLSLPVEEIIVVNDASKDGTKEYLDDLENDKLKIVHHTTRKYLPAARNSGIKASTQPYILMGEDDVIMDEDYVETLYRVLTEKKADFAAGRLISMQRGENTEIALERSNKENKTQLLYPRRFSFDYSCQIPEPFETPCLHACSMFKKEWAEKNPYCEKYKGNALREESDFYMTNYAGGARMYFCSDSVAYHMFHDYKGGCRSNIISYTWSSIGNNRFFLKRHWKTVKKVLKLNESRLRYELRLDLIHIFNNSVQWMAKYTPGLYRFCKSIRDKRN